MASPRTCHAAAHGVREHRRATGGRPKGRRGVEAGPARPGWQSAAARLAKPLLDQTSDWWRRRLVAGGVDATGLLSGRDLLVLAPHPDDETLGAGAAVARARAAGNRVTVAVATDGRHSTASGPLSPQRLGEVRSAELHAPCRTLGVPDDDVVQLGYVYGTVAARWPEIADRLTGLLDERSPDVVFVPCACGGPGCSCRSRGRSPVPAGAAACATSSTTR